MIISPVITVANDKEALGGICTTRTFIGNRWCHLPIMINSTELTHIYSQLTLVEKLRK